jgi:hypothetical protein
VEQDIHWDDDQTIVDPDLLAEIYFEFSASGQIEAHERALRLEASIRCCITPDRWSPAAIRKTSRRSLTRKKLELRHPSLAKQISAPTAAVPSSAPIQPVRELSFRWRAPKQPIRELSFKWPKTDLWTSILDSIPQAPPLSDTTKHQVTTALAS